MKYIVNNWDFWGYRILYTADIPLIPKVNLHWCTINRIYLD